MICRRDSFITHRAFCDALSEENNKFNQEGQLSNIHGSNLQQPIIPNLVSSFPINITNNHNKHPLSLPQHLMTTMPLKPFNNMDAFTRSLSSTSSPSQLTSNSPNINLLELENGLHSPHMSATALLQKAAQIGSTANSNISNMSEKGFVTSMAPPSYGIMNNNISQEELTHYNFNGNGIDGGGDGMAMSGLDMFNVILDQSKALSKIIEQNNIRSMSNGVLHAHAMNGRSNGSNVDVSGTKGSDDVMTLDLLGIGGGGDGNFYGGDQQSEMAARDDGIWRNWSNKNEGPETFSATNATM